MFVFWIVRLFTHVSSPITIPGISVFITHLLNWIKCEKVGKCMHEYCRTLMFLQQILAQELGTSLLEWLLEWENMTLRGSQGRKYLLLTKALNTKQSKWNWKPWVLILPHVVYLQPWQLRQDFQRHALFIVGCRGCVSVHARTRVCVCMSLGMRVVHCFFVYCQTKNKVFLLHFWKQVRYCLLNDYSRELLLT